jgi:hypothetical protein
MVVAAAAAAVTTPQLGQSVAQAQAILATMEVLGKSLRLVPVVVAVRHPQEVMEPQVLEAQVAQALQTQSQGQVSHARQEGPEAMT